jgi:hypothetical protein
MNVALLALGLLSVPAYAAPALQPQPLSSESYAEVFTAVASLEDGSFTLVQLMFTNAGIGNRKAACRALWIPPGKAGINASAHFSSDEWAYNSASATLNVGNCSLSENGSAIAFAAKVPDLDVELNIQSVPKNVNPPGNRIEHKDAYYKSKLIVPYARTTATIQSKGQTVSTKGAAHLTHSISNLLMPNAAACWLRFRGFFGSAPTLAQVRIPPGGGEPEAWVWPLTAPKPTAVASNQVNIQVDEHGQPSISIGGSHPLSLEPKQRIYRYRPTESYGALGRLASPWIGDPTTTTYRAKGTSGGASVSGILEVLEVNEPGCAAQ